MSWWGGIEATFRGGGASVEGVRRGVPTGSEGDDSVEVYEHGGVVYVTGRLRDVTDAEDSPAVLAWFARAGAHVDEADLEWELDEGPRYRWRLREGRLTRLRGVLEQ